MRLLAGSFGILGFVFGTIGQVTATTLNDGACHTISTNLGMGELIYVYDGPGPSSTFVNVVPGGVFGGLYAHDSSQVELSGGALAVLTFCDSSLGYLSGGSSTWITTDHSSEVDLFGGSFSYLYASGSSKVNVHGQGLNWSGTSGDPLTGKLADGTEVDLIVYRYQDAQINLIPEPSTLLLLGTGGLGLLIWSRRRRLGR